MNQIDVDTLRTWLETGHPVTVVDVRPAADHSEWAVPGSIHVDAYDALKAGDRHALDVLALPDDVPVVTICGAGKVSLTAAEQLRERGLQALSLAGGMRAWSLAWNVAEVPGLAAGGARVFQVRRTGKGCLSYLIGSNGEAAVIDAALDPTVYHNLAEQYGWRITAVIDTHIHADHLSRARSLADQTGATLYLPAQQRKTFPFTPLHDGASVPIGDSRLTALHTAGHTPESTSYLLDDTMIFTGDTLFLAAVGRPDLHGKPDEAAAHARVLYASLQRLLRLPPATLVLPGHTSAPVAFDGKPIGATLAEVQAQAQLLHLDESAFVSALLQRFPPTPPNHQQIVALNEAGALPATDVTELEAGANRCAVG